MKELKKLQEANGHINEIRQRLTSLSNNEIAAYLKKAEKLLSQFMLANTQEIKVGKFDITNWVSADNMRPQITGVYYDDDNKCCVATDTHVLVACKSLWREMPEEMQTKAGQKIISPKGEVLDTGIKFPNYRRVFPTNNEPKDVLSKAELREIAKAINADRKLNKLKADRYMVEFTEGWWMSGGYLQHVLSLPSWDCWSFDPADHWKPAVYNDGDIEALIMPMNYENGKEYRKICEHCECVY